MLIFSGFGNDQLWSEYTSKNDVSHMVVGRAIISAHWFKPLKNSKGETIGTELIYLNCTDVGSNAPAWLLNTFIPNAVKESFQKVVEYIKNY